MALPYLFDLGKASTHKLSITYFNLNSGYFRVQSTFCGEVFDSETVG